MAVSKRLRYEILKRDQHKCKGCGRGPDEVVLTVDHVVPVALGGSDEPKNLRALCRDCNGGKSSIPADAPLVESVSADALRWAQAMRQAAEEIAAQDDVLEDILAAVRQAWKPYYMPADWAASVVTFVKAGLSQDDLLAMVKVAYAKRGIGTHNRWAYFCGCCWTRVRQYQDRASEILAAATSTEAPLSTVWTHADIDEVVSDAEDLASGLEDLGRACRHVDWTADGPRHCGDPICVVEHATHLAHAALDWHFAESNRQQRDESILAELEAIDG